MLRFGLIMPEKNDAEYGCPTTAGVKEDEGNEDSDLTLFADEALLSLLADVRVGKSGAFSSLYERYRPLTDKAVNQYFRRFCGDQPEEYKELEEEACIALYRAAVSYVPDRHSTFGLYARTCVRNRLVSYLRKHCRRRSVEPPTAEEPAENEWEAAEDPLDTVLSDESYRNLMDRFTGALTPFEKEVFRRYAGGMPYKRIAGELGIAEKSVDNAVYRIRRKLKSSLGF